MRRQFSETCPAGALRDTLGCHLPAGHKSALQPVPAGTLVLQMAHVDGNHWVLICSELGRVEEGTQRRRCVLDSLYNRSAPQMLQHPELMLMLRNMAPGPGSDPFVSDADLANSFECRQPQRQQGTAECGCFVIAWAVLWLQGMDPCSTRQLQQSGLRAWLEDCLQHSRFVAPPR
jgi:hypothetical protein